MDIPIVLKLAGVGVATLALVRPADGGDLERLLGRALG